MTACPLSTLLWPVCFRITKTTLHDALLAYLIFF